jgi:ATP-dependent helicase HrpA
MQLKKIQSCEEEYESLLGRFAGKVIPQDVYDVRFMIEELRVSLFAQVLKTYYPVSDKRVLIEIDRLNKLYH